MRRARSSPPATPMSWLTTYGDMVTLLMTFFILLFALSTLNQRKFQSVSGSLQATFGGVAAGNGGVITGGDGILSGGADQMLKLQTEDEAQLQEVQKKVSSYIEENQLLDVISVQNDPRGLLIRFRDQVLFDLGSAELKNVSKGALDTVAEAISRIPNDVRIEGHTDDLPISTSRFPSNWDLSAARASAVLQYLTRARPMDANRLSIAGYGEHRPVASNKTEDGRRRNRRVDIVILSMTEGLQEPKTGNR